MKTNNRLPLHNFECMICNESFQASSRKKFSCCSVTCRRIQVADEKFQGMKEGLDYIKCPICKLKVKQFSTQHAKNHGFSNAKEMQKQLHLPRITCDSQKEFFRGANNPGYQHGGKFSKWSKSFIHGYDADSHALFSAEQSEKKKITPGFFQFEFWLKKTNGDANLAKELYTESQTKNLHWFIQKYGDIDGPIRHKNKIDKWVNTMNSKPIEELLSINSRKVRKSLSFSSKAERRIFDDLKEIYPEIQGQFSLCKDPMSEKKRFWIYDMMVGDKIIEYNGDFWHANPEIYNESFVNRANKQTFAEIHDKDKKKIRAAIAAGYEVLVIWEKDYKENSQKVLEQCIKFLSK